MRKVAFKKWIPVEYVESKKGYPHRDERVLNTGCWESGYSLNGLFHKWASAFEEFESGAGNYTVAIVELKDGVIVEVLPTNLKFEDKLSL
jgi:hypothetical protein